MKAQVAFLYGPGNLRVQEVEVPKLKPDQVLVKVRACGICGSDIECFEGLSAERRYDLGSYTPGHEWGGEIVEIGSKVTSLKKRFRTIRRKNEQSFCPFGLCKQHCL